MKPPRRPKSSKKNDARRERALAIAKNPERYGADGRAWLAKHKHLIEAPKET